ncbi:MAG: HAD family hydrolase [Brevinematales bacterium]|nr:HAD family hydrolase [Brevinematales bacterium]
MVNIEGIIFDLDGTLLDTLDDIVDAGNNVLRRLGVVPVEKEKYRDFIGGGVKELFIRLLNYRNEFSEEKLEKSLILMKEEYSRNYLNKTKPYDGIYDMLKFLKEQKYKMSILSNKQHFFTKELVEHFFKDFDFIVVRGIENSEDRKPNPKLALEIARIMEVKPQGILFIGDSVIDVITAKNSNMISVMVSWGFKSLDEIGEVKPDYIMHHPMDIKNILS